jgi:hypothetical protein
MSSSVSESKPNRKPTPEKQISHTQRKKATRKVLHSTLRLLVLLRETLVVQGVPQDNALHKSVFMHANLIGSLLPNDALISPDELANIRASVGSVPTTETPEGVVEPAKPSLTSIVKRALGGKGDIVVLNPDLSRYDLL